MLRHVVSQFVSFLMLCLFLAGMQAHGQEEGKRIALVIGNNNYPVSPLRNAINDARLMEKALKGAGFTVVLKEDASFTQMEEAVAKLAEQVGPDDTALFFYAGHGVQIEAENFLVPVDFEPTSTITEAKFKCFRLNLLFEELKKRAKRSIIILDACRSNPVSSTHGLQAGLAQPQVAGAQMYIAFSTSPGQVAADNPAGRNSYFTEALGDLIQQPDLSLGEIFTKVKARVATDTEGRQSPWEMSNLTTNFYFHAPSRLDTANDPSVAEKWMLDAQRREQREEWDEAIRLVNQVISRKPGGMLERTAVAKLPYLTLQKEAQAKYDAADYKGAAGTYEKTLELDPFALDSAFQAVNTYLLSDELPAAVRLLSVIRERGTTASIERADAMLKQLAPVYPEAATVLKADVPKPPDLQQLFKDIQFGVPDWSAGVRSAQSAPLQLGRWVKTIATAYPPPPDPVVAQASEAKELENELLHVEVKASSGGRDLSIKKLDDSEPTGALVIMGSLGPSAKVLAGGQTMAEQLPATIRLLPGKYQVEIIEKNAVTGSQEVEVVAFQTKTITLQRNK